MPRGNGPASGCYGAPMDVAEYATRAGLALSTAAVRAAQQSLWRVLEANRHASVPATPGALDLLYTYRVPALAPDGSCAPAGALDPTPYDLGEVLGGRDQRTSLRLMALDALVEESWRDSGADWLGVYQARQVKGGRALVKLAYRGLPSRAEFPLTEGFARRSINSAVGLSGEARVLDDVPAHARAGGAYYECDPTVRAEACLPIFAADHTLAGIVDAEARTLRFFHPERLARLVALALEAGACLP